MKTKPWYSSLFSKSVNSESKQSAVIHLGPHKTGTTSFQSLLEYNEKELIKSNFSLVTVRSSHKNHYKEWRKKYANVVQGYLIGRFTSGLALKQLCELFCELINEFPENKSLVLSDENLLGPMPGHYFAGRRGRETGFYSARKIVFEAIFKAFSAYEIKIIICRRDEVDFITSSYRDFISKLKDSEDLLTFSGKLDNDFHIQFSSFYEDIQAQFESRLITYEFGAFVTKMPQTVFTLFQINVDFPEVVHKNQSLSWGAIEAALKELDSKKQPFTENERKAFFERSKNLPKTESKFIQGQIDIFKSIYFSPRDGTRATRP